MFDHNKQSQWVVFALCFIALRQSWHGSEEWCYGEYQSQLHAVLITESSENRHDVYVDVCVCLCVFVYLCVAEVQVNFVTASSIFAIQPLMLAINF